MVGGGGFVGLQAHAPATCPTRAWDGSGDGGSTDGSAASSPLHSGGCRVAPASRMDAGGLLVLVALAASRRRRRLRRA
jgi:hypothetical protein